MEDKRTLLYVVFGSAALLLSACAIWRLNKNGDCPFKSQPKYAKLKKTAFHGQVKWESSQVEKEQYARIWMERYVKNAIVNRSKANLTKDFLERNLQRRKRAGSNPEEVGKQDNDESDQAGSGNGTFQGGMDYSLEPENIPRKAKTFAAPISSFELEGTGRYENVSELRSCIANEKGLLSQDDFEHIQKVIEVYSKALLCETRQKHLKARIESYKARDWKRYSALVFEQQAKEIKIFNRATLEILDAADIKTPVFNQSVELIMITSQDSMLQSAKLSLYTPFEVSKENQNIDFSKALLMLNEATDAALTLIQLPQLLEVI